MAHAVAAAVEGADAPAGAGGDRHGQVAGLPRPGDRARDAHGETAIVATATLALQGQIVARDLPRLASSLEPLLGRKPTFALVKGRANYVCAHKLEGGFPDDPDEGALLGVGSVDAAASRLGKEVVRVREWAKGHRDGEREDLTRA